MKKTPAIAGIIIALAGAAVAFFMMTHVSPATSKTVTPVSGTVVPSSTLQTRVTPEGKGEYANAQYHFSLFYPDELKGTEYAEAGGGRTVSFENADGSKGFQVYITPYNGAQITESRILYDTHKTATAPREIVLANGTHALIFYSDGGALGKVREVWFLHGGFLYEVTTYADLDAWLSDILNSLAFI